MSTTSENITRLFIDWDKVSKRSPFALKKILMFLYLAENGLAERAMVEEMWRTTPPVLVEYKTLEEAASDPRGFAAYVDKLQASAEQNGW